jgi:hypothetical protein
MSGYLGGITLILSNNKLPTTSIWDDVLAPKQTRDKRQHTNSSYAFTGAVETVGDLRLVGVLDCDAKCVEVVGDLWFCLGAAFVLVCIFVHGLPS